MITRQSLIDTFYLGEDPYVGHDTNKWPAEDILDWGSTHPWFNDNIKALQPKVIIEVGTFLGGSAIRMADYLKECGLKDSIIICVDTWLADLIILRLLEHRSKLKIQNGRPMFYHTFLSNVIKAGHQDMIIPVSLPSVQAAHYLYHFVGQNIARFIYVDGSHQEGEVIRDLDAYWKLLEPRGRMLIDDYTSDFEGVVKDIHKFSDQVKTPFMVHSGKALFEKYI